MGSSGLQPPRGAVLPLRSPQPRYSITRVRLCGMGGRDKNQCPRITASSLPHCPSGRSGSFPTSQQPEMGSVSWDRRDSYHPRGSAGGGKDALGEEG